MNLAMALKYVRTSTSRMVLVMFFELQNLDSSAHVPFVRTSLYEYFQIQEFKQFQLERGLKQETSPP
jgi:hypothetical protein